jgi:hypothetical protein
MTIRYCPQCGQPWKLFHDSDNPADRLYVCFHAMNCRPTGYSDAVMSNCPPAA